MGGGGCSSAGIVGEPARTTSSKVEVAIQKDMRVLGVVLNILRQPPEENLDVVHLLLATPVIVDADHVGDVLVDVDGEVHDTTRYHLAHTKLRRVIKFRHQQQKSSSQTPMPSKVKVMMMSS